MGGCHVFHISAEEKRTSQVPLGSGETGWGRRMSLLVLGGGMKQELHERNATLFGTLLKLFSSRQSCKNLHTV